MARVGERERRVKEREKRVQARGQAESESQDTAAQLRRVGWHDIGTKVREKALEEEAGSSS
jgi:hypothetical protein